MNTALAKRSWLLGWAAGLLASAAMGPITPADARITRIVITTTTSAYDGFSFGAVGPYEQLDGTAYGEVDPRDPLNTVIQDVQLAPRNARGMVEYSMGISILKPVDGDRHRHGVLASLHGAQYDRRGGREGPADPARSATLSFCRHSARRW